MKEPRSDSDSDSDSELKLERDITAIDRAIRTGHFGRWLALVAGVSSALSGLEVSYEHYTGGYSRRVMYTPVILSGALCATGVAGFFNRRVARTALPAVAVVTVVDCAIGFYFHVRGIARKPGGWKLPVTNMAMGPPIFAPLLFGVSAYLALLAAVLCRSDANGPLGLPPPATSEHRAKPQNAPESGGWVQNVREGRFQQQLAIATALAAFLSGFEAWYSHYKNNFRYRVQWSPVVIAPMLCVAGLAAVKSSRAARTWLPSVSAIAVMNGMIGFAYHLRGVLRRSGGTTKFIYNIMYGPPLFAPLLFAASGSLGLLASLLRREDRR